MFFNKDGRVGQVEVRGFCSRVRFKKDNKHSNDIKLLS